MQASDKTQEVRLIDVFALGPFMVWFANRATGVPPWAKALMLVAGVLTILYNYRNYVRNGTVRPSILP